jgi:hypothetical protein
MTFHLFAGDAGRDPAFANVASADPETGSSTDRPARTSREPEHPKSDRRQKRSAAMVIVAGHITVEPQQRESYLAGCVSIVE